MSATVKNSLFFTIADFKQNDVDFECFCCWLWTSKCLLGHHIKFTHWRLVYFKNVLQQMLFTPILFSTGTMLWYSLLNKNAGDTFKYYILENLISSEIKLCRQYDRGTSETKTGKSKATYICFFHLKFVKMKKIFSIVALKQPNSEGRIFVLYKYLRRLLTRTVSPKFLSDNLSL